MEKDLVDESGCIAEDSNEVEAGVGVGGPRGEGGRGIGGNVGFELEEDGFFGFGEG